MSPKPKPATSTRRPSIAALGVAVAIAVASGAAGAEGTGKRGHVKFDGGWANHPSAKYAAMSADACTHELDARHVVYTPAPGSAGVLAPIRLPKGAGGVLFRSDAPDHALATSPYDVLDCRLALALHDYAKILRAHDIEEVRIFSAWRPTRGLGPGPATRHPGGLAIDISRFGKKIEPNEKERRWLVVERDFHGRPGTPPCGSAAVAPAPASSEAKELRSLLCEAVDQHLFTVMLTPNYDHAHRNHFHLEVTPEVSWTLLR